MDETNADYFVETYADNRQVKIIAKSTQEIVASFSLPASLASKDAEDQYLKDRVIVWETLKRMGIKVIEQK